MAGVANDYVESIAQQVADGTMTPAMARVVLGAHPAPNANAQFNDERLAASGSAQAIAERLSKAITNSGGYVIQTGSSGFTNGGGGGKSGDGDETGERSARAIIMATLGEYGLESLAEWAWNEFKAGSPIEQIMLEIRNRPEYEARFPGLKPLRSKGRAISEREYIGIERTITQVFQANGLPLEVFGTRDFIGRIIANETSPAEVADRVGLLEADIGRFTADPGVQQELEAFERFYGVRPTFGDLAALALNTDEALPVLQRKFTAVRNERAAGRAGYGDLTRTEAERLADLGVNEQQATEGFGALAATREVFDILPGLEGSEERISREEQLGAAFEGNTLARQRIERKRRQRQAQFQGGGGFAGSQSGFGGLGSSR